MQLGAGLPARLLLDRIRFGHGGVWAHRKGRIVMKRMKRIVSLVLCCVMTAGVLTAGTGCSKSSDDKVLRVGMECSYAPYNWTQDDNSNGGVKINDSDKYANGFDVQMAQKIADSMGYKLEIVKTEWDGLVPAVQSGKINAVIAGMSITAKRAASVDFSDPYYVADVVVLTMNKSKFAAATSIKDLSGAKMTSQINTVWYDLLSQIPGADVQTALDTVPSLLVALTSGKIDACTVDVPTAMAAVYSNPDIKTLTFNAGNGFDVSHEDTDLGIAVKKGSTDLLAGINKGLAGISTDDRAAIMKAAIANQPLAQ
jgi:putative lysine transport system substrate-binding protein